MGGGDVRGVSDFTFSSLLAGSYSRYVAVAAEFGCRLYGMWCISVIDGSGHAVTLDAAADLIWHSQVPLKVTIFVWQLLRDMLPTKANLVSQGILSQEAHYCVSGCGVVESTQHVFLVCSTFGSLWSFVGSWIGSSLVIAQTIPDHFVQFTSSTGGSHARRSFMQLIWLACVWVVWTERNHRLFTGSTTSVHQMLDKIKSFSYRWLKATSSTLTLNCHMWWSSLLLCLGLV
ncbi:unnamed protein product [Trifolium pratense]|uniref:Uncharacterized protein n=1 Tax=Trifolium pratense TaxID=57577 RepID=A0ACB0JUK1_TRIPR|nr:unnamed protein product [Trifolium pratense]